HTPQSTLFPYTTLFRSSAASGNGASRSRSWTIGGSRVSQLRDRSGENIRHACPAMVASPNRATAQAAPMVVAMAARAESPKPIRSEEHTSELQSLAYLV